MLSCGAEGGEVRKNYVSLSPEIRLYEEEDGKEILQIELFIDDLYFRSEEYGGCVHVPVKALEAVVEALRAIEAFMQMREAIKRSDKKATLKAAEAFEKAVRDEDEDEGAAAPKEEE